MMIIIMIYGYAIIAMLFSIVIYSIRNKPVRKNFLDVHPVAYNIYI